MGRDDFSDLQGMVPYPMLFPETDEGVTGLALPRLCQALAEEARLGNVPSHRLVAIAEASFGAHMARMAEGG